MKFDSKLVKKLCETVGLSGEEMSVSELIKETVSPYVDEIYTDSLGNLIARKKGNGKKIMFAAHMDQIGMMITEITEKGFLKFASIGGLIPFTLIGQQVIFKDGFYGVINTEMDLESSKDYGRLDVSSLYIDIGANTKEMAEERVKIGDTATFSNYYYEDERIVMSRALDDRIGCYVLMEALKSDKKSDADVYYVFTVQEEVGTRGAQTASYGIEKILMCQWEKEQLLR
jgi:endoglucanase